MRLNKMQRHELEEWRPHAVVVQGMRIPGSVPYLRGMLAVVNDPFLHDVLLGELADEYFRAGLDDELLRIQRERVANHPESSVGWLSLASTLSCRDSGGAYEARVAATKGVALARDQGVLVRFALLCQANIARRIGESALFEQSVRDLIADAPNARIDDCWLNLELITGLPDGFCSPALIEQYRTFAGAKA